jgi:hypothetical protein
MQSSEPCLSLVWIRTTNPSVTGRRHPGHNHRRPLLREPALFQDGSQVSLRLPLATPPGGKRRMHGLLRQCARCSRGNLKERKGGQHQPELRSYVGVLSIMVMYSQLLLESRRYTSIGWVA